MHSASDCWWRCTLRYRHRLSQVYVISSFTFSPPSLLLPLSLYPLLPFQLTFSSPLLPLLILWYRSLEHPHSRCTFSCFVLVCEMWGRGYRERKGEGRREGTTLLMVFLFSSFLFFFLSSPAAKPNVQAVDTTTQSATGKTTGYTTSSLWLRRMNKDVVLLSSTLTSSAPSFSSTKQIKWKTNHPLLRPPSRSKKDVNKQNRIY